MKKRYIYIWSFILQLTNVVRAHLRTYEQNKSLFFHHILSSVTLSIFLLHAVSILKLLLRFVAFSKNYVRLERKKSNISLLILMLRFSMETRKLCEGWGRGRGGEYRMTITDVQMCLDRNWIFVDSRGEGMGVQKSNFLQTSYLNIY